MKLINKIKWDAIDITYCFDTCALPYILKSKENGVEVILESRGSHIDQTLSMKEKVSQIYSTKKPFFS